MFFTGVELGKHKNFILQFENNPNPQINFNV